MSLCLKTLVEKLRAGGSFQGPGYRLTHSDHYVALIQLMGFVAWKLYGYKKVTSLKTRQEIQMTLNIMS